MNTPLPDSSSKSSSSSSSSLKNVEIPTLKFKDDIAIKKLEKIRNKISKFRAKLLEKLTELDGIRFLNDKQVESMITPQSRDVKRRMQGLFSKWKQTDTEMTAKVLASFDVLDNVFRQKFVDRANCEQLFDRARVCYIAKKDLDKKKEEAKRKMEEAKRYKQELDEEFVGSNYKLGQNVRVEEVKDDSESSDSSDEDNSNNKDSTIAQDSARNILDDIFPTPLKNDAPAQIKEKEFDDVVKKIDMD